MRFQYAVPHRLRPYASPGRLFALLLLLPLLLLAGAGATPARAQDDFLPPEQAFVFSARMAGPDTVQVDFAVAPGYYMYRERFAFTLEEAGVAEATGDPGNGEPIDSARSPDDPGTGGNAANAANAANAGPAAGHAVTLGTARFPVGEIKYDPTFEKEMEVYHRPFSILLPLETAGSAARTARVPLLLTVTGQGCADKGVCYPPMDMAVRLDPAVDGYAVAAPASKGSLLAPGQGSASAAGLPPSGGIGPTAVAPALSGVAALTRADDVGLAGALAGMGWLRTAAVFLLLGLLLSLTPCVLPMIPILSTLILGGDRAPRPTRRRGLGLAAAYVLGMSVVYTLMGIAAGLSGAGLAAWLQTPWVLALFALLLALLALAMFDVYTLQAPPALQSALTHWLARVPGGRTTGALVMGAVSALIVGPCVAAPLAGALLYISQTRDVVLGGSALFALAWGMGVPLLIVGASAGALLPRAGPWMDGVKRFFGMLLLGTAWSMLAPVLPVPVQMAGWALLLLISAVMLGAFEALGAAGAPAWQVRRAFAKGLGLCLALCGVVMLAGAASGGRDLLRPLAHLAERTTPSGRAATAVPTLDFLPVRSNAELDAQLAGAAARGIPVLLDFYADWCASCHEMERFTFTDPEVARRMAGMVLLRADVTANNADDRALLRRFRLFGPPGILFFDTRGAEIAGARVIGFQDARRFERVLEKAVAG